MASYTFVEPILATVRVPVATNPDGNIAISGDEITGNKSIVFSYTKRDATAQEILYGTSADSENATTTGIVSTFIEYILGGIIDPVGIKRTISQTTTYDEGE